MQQIEAFERKHQEGVKNIKNQHISIFPYSKRSAKRQHWGLSPTPEFNQKAKIYKPVGISRKKKPTSTANSYFVKRIQVHLTLNCARSG